MAMYPEHHLLTYGNRDYQLTIADFALNDALLQPMWCSVVSLGDLSNHHPQQNTTSAP